TATPTPSPTPGATPTPTETPAPAPTTPPSPTPSATPAPTLAAPPPPAAAPGAFLLRIERAAPTLGFTYDVLLEAVDEAGKPLGLPRLAVTLPQGLSSISQPGLDAAYAGAARFVVLDANLVGSRTCAGSSCVFALRSPL